MKKYNTLWTLVVTGFSLVLTTDAFASDAKHPCKADSKKLCAQVAFTEVPNCLLRQETKLSLQCNQAITKNLERGPACTNSRKRICADKTLGNGLGSCILENEKALNEACAREKSAKL